MRAFAGVRNEKKLPWLCKIGIKNSAEYVCIVLALYKSIIIIIIIIIYYYYCLLGLLGTKTSRMSPQSQPVLPYFGSESVLWQYTVFLLTKLNPSRGIWSRRTAKWRNSKEWNLMVTQGKNFKLLRQIFLLFNLLGREGGSWEQGWLN